MKEKWKDLDLFGKIGLIEKVMYELVGKKSDKEIKNVLCHCYTFKRGLRKGLTTEEQIVYDYLYRQGLNPKTIYFYYLQKKMPERLRRAIKSKKISIRNASKKFAEIKRLKDEEKARVLLASIKKAVKEVRNHEN